MTVKNQNQTAMVPYTFENRKPGKRGKRVSLLPHFSVGQKNQGGKVSHGGGGIENKGGMTDTQAGVSFVQSQPSWRWEFENDMFGAAAPSLAPVTAGGGHPSNPSNNFRALGDLHGGRQ